MAALSSTKHVVIQAAPEVIWKIQTDINRWSAWNPAISSAHMASPPAAGSTFVWKSGGLSIESVVQAFEPIRLISWSGKSLGTKASHSWTLESNGTETLVTTEESMTGWLVSLLKLLAPRFLDKSLDSWLQALKAEAEAGHRTAA